jgi:hypothetical protein
MPLANDPDRTLEGRGEHTRRLLLVECSSRQIIGSPAELGPATLGSYRPGASALTAASSASTEPYAARLTDRALRMSCSHTCEVSLKTCTNAPKLNNKAIPSSTEIGLSSRRLQIADWG